MIKIILISVIGIMAIYCSAPYYKLENGNKILINKYKNIKYFDKTTFNQIDSYYFYKKVDFYMSDRNFNKKREIGNDVDRSIQFYGNGRLRFFSFDIINHNPEVVGMRGIIYKKDGKIKIDTQFSDQFGNILKGTYSVKIEGDYLFLLDDNFLVSRNEYICFVYKKSDEKIPENWKVYNTDW